MLNFKSAFVVQQVLTLTVGNGPTAKNKFPATSLATVRLVVILNKYKLLDSYYL